MLVDRLLKIKKEFKNLKKQEILVIFIVIVIAIFGDFKDSTKRTAADKVLRDKEFNIAKNHKYDGYQRRLASVVYKFFDKKFSGSGANDEIKQNM